MRANNIPCLLIAAVILYFLECFLCGSSLALRMIRLFDCGRNVLGALYYLGIYLHDCGPGFLWAIRFIEKCILADGAPTCGGY